MMKNLFRIKYITQAGLLGLVLLYGSCKSKNNNQSLFRVLGHEQTGLHFANKLQPTPAFNLFTYMYYYNGAGVGAGDFNKDGKTDLFFASNQGNNTLYLNEGNMQFKDVSREAGIPTDGGWSTGVSVVDINNDGLLDIYVCRVGQYKVLKGKNQLLVCKGVNAQGIPVYEDEATAYGLDFSGFSTQAAFLDYDGDGDLDMFLLNHSVNHDGNYAPRAQFTGTYDSLAGQRLYRNDTKTDTKGVRTGRFTNVTETTGINGTKIGYGLGVVVSDINLDGWPDLYVGNDFHENDYLYINQRNGTFKEEGAQQMMHTSQFSMGVDAADLNNDAYPEIISMDMLPYDPYMLRRSLAEDDYNIFQQKLSYGYTYQYARNNLQLNRKNNHFSEIGQYAGVNATDWSWAALFMDFDNDGNKDLFVSNGIPKRMNDIDYINYVSGEELQQKLQKNQLQDKDLSLIEKFPEIKIPNQFFRNKGDLSFANLTDSIPSNPGTFSNGAVYADLDNDGDLDIVVNNINDPALIYENTSAVKNTNDFTRLQLQGSTSNTQAVGARLLVFSGTKQYAYESQPVHGFLSSMMQPLLVGLKNIKVDSAVLIWPDRTYQQLTLHNGKTDTIAYQSGLPLYKYPGSDKNDGGLEDITASSGLQYLHQENVFNEFDREPLIPQMMSTEGPALAVADINGDGLEDVFIGAARTYTAAVFLQNKQGRFQRMAQPALEKDIAWEHNDAVWTDVNGDGFPDLVIATGGNEFYGNDIHLSPLLYLNDGKGNLTRKTDAFEQALGTQSKILTTDLNGDGYADLFIAGRSVPWAYGMTPRSYLLVNDGTGRFHDMTERYCKDLVMPGMVTDAAWADMNADGVKDLLLSYQWGGIDLFVRKASAFEKKAISTEKGWWQSIYVTDVNGDGDPDVVAGNLGLNTRLHASEQQPVRMYMNDFDNNGRVEQLLTYYVGGKEIPFSSKLQLEKSIPVLRKKYLYAADYAKADLKDIFGQDKLDKAFKLTATQFAHMVFINDGKGGYTGKALPAITQVSNGRAMARMNHGIFFTGNFLANHVEIGRQDASLGTLLQFGKNGQAEIVPTTGLPVTGQVRRIQPIIIGQRKAYLLARNNDALLVLAEK